MTDTTPTTDATEPTEAAEPAEVPTAEEPTPEPPIPAEEPAPSAEAAKYRTRLRATEAELDDARAHIGELQAEVIRNLLAGVLADPTDFDVHIGLERVLGEDGRIDKTKLSDALSGLLDAKPHLAPPKPRGGRQAMRAGTPLPNKAPGDPASALDRAFPRGHTRWSDVLGYGQRAEATEARTSKVEFDVRKEIGQ